jgi:hypothetical protein
MATSAAMPYGRSAQWCSINKKEGCRPEGRQPLTNPMTFKYQIVLLILLLCAGQTSGLAAAQPIELKWNELTPVIQGHRVEVALKEGTKIQGEAVVVRGDSLVVEVKKVSGGKTYHKGSAAIPRTEISLIKLERTRGNWGRKLGVTIGLLSGLTVGGYVAATATHSAGAGIPLFLGVASAVTLAGYYAGRGLDGRITLIRIIPE